VLPASVDDLHGQVPDGQRNPGLELDKFTRPRTEQKDQKDDLEAICRAGRNQALLGQLHEQRGRALKELPAFTGFRARTAGPLTLHLAREAALENAGLHLHPLYGFCCLPATGLKGMTRAWAETVWLKEQPEAERAAARGRIDEVFGSATGEAASAGVVVFHDAWPAEWPKLVVDITNNHHTSSLSDFGSRAV